MKIALVILHADPTRGGAERYTVDLAAGLARRGHDVQVISTSFRDDIPKSSRVAIDQTALTRVGNYRQFLDQLDALLAENKYDIVHAMLPVRKCDIYHPHAGMAAAGAKKFNAPFNARRRLMARVERELLTGEKPPIVIALSEYVKRAIRQSFPLSDKQLATLFNAVDLDRFQPPDSKPARDYVNGLFIGQDFARKGLMTALVAASMLKDPRLKLTVVGKRSGSFHLPADAAAQMSFAGETGDPRPFYRDADFFVLPTKHDPCSLVVLEALAMGVPVISTKFNGATEIMIDGVHGYVLEDPEDADALADAMRKICDPARRAEMSRACLELRPKLSYETHLTQLEAIYAAARS